MNVKLCTPPPSFILQSLFIECQEVVFPRPNPQFAVLTHTVGYLAFRQNKRGFSAAVLEPLAHLMHLNVLAVVRGHSVGEKTALLIGPKMETQFGCALVINM